MKQKYYDSQGAEIPLAEEIKLAFYFIEYPIKKDWVKNMEGDISNYYIAKNIYKILSKFLKDSEINTLGTMFLGMVN